MLALLSLSVVVETAAGWETVAESPIPEHPQRSMTLFTHLPIRKKPYYVMCRCPEGLRVDKIFTYSIMCHSQSHVDVAFTTPSYELCTARYQLCYQGEISTKIGTKITWGSQGDRDGEHSAATGWRPPNSIALRSTSVTRLRVTRVKCDDPSGWYVEVAHPPSGALAVLTVEGQVAAVPVCPVAVQELRVRVMSRGTMSLIGEGVLQTARGVAHGVDLVPSVASVYIEIL